MDLGISGRNAAVAAASKGLGFSSAKALLAEGANVAICGRDATRINEAAAALGEGVVPIVADVSNAEEARRFVEDAAAALGPVDILVANAGGPPPGTFATTELSAYQDAIDLNYLSTVAMCQAAIPAMQERGWGRVVAITSIGARQPIGNLIASVAARTAVTGFMKTVALEVAGDGVTVNTIQPGMHATDRLRGAAGGDLDALAKTVPAQMIGDPDDFGAAVAFLCSEQAKFITGIGLLLDGGAMRALQ